MFTGIVAAVGRITAVRPAAGGLRLRIEAGSLDLKDVAVGDSIAVNGVCLTVVARKARSFEADVSPETLACTTGLAKGRRINLEKALRLADRLGGHLVSGHVDGVGTVTRVRRTGGNRVVTVKAPARLARYIARKGSVTVNGVSLTVNDVKGAEIAVNLIPHTLAATNLGELGVRGKVNLEVDMLARYIERLFSASPSVPSSKLIRRFHRGN
jgi:riboflavin synthase